MCQNHVGMRGGGSHREEGELGDKKKKKTGEWRNEESTVWRTALGSSRRTTFGDPMIAIPSESFRLFPPLSLPASFRR